jgi:hypothetical protein
MWKIVAVVLLICSLVDLSLIDRNGGAEAFSTMLIQLPHPPHSSTHAKTTLIRRWVHSSAIQDETENSNLYCDVSVEVIHEQPVVQIIPRPSEALQLELSSSLEEKDESMHRKLEKEPDRHELGIWVARGLLLLVAAIWGTNFAVRWLSQYTAVLGIFSLHSFFKFHHHRVLSIWRIYVFIHPVITRRRRRHLHVLDWPPL